MAYLAIGVSAAVTSDELTIRSAWVAMEIIGWYALVPLAVVTVVTGVMMSLITPWGLFQHYWVVVSLLFTVISTIVLILHMPDVSSATAVARAGTSADVAHLGSDLAHPSIGLAILLVVAVLNTYKPKGMTRRGQRLTRSRTAARRQAA
ncbi:DUF2269 domain-containing protein [Kribbella swartbergensis]